MKVLVLSGASSKASYFCGIIKHLIGDLEINYDAYVGVSSGSLCAAALSQFKAGEEKLASKTLEKLWLSIDNSKIYKHWKPFKFLHSIYKGSLYDSSPLKNLLYNNLDLTKIRSSGKEIRIGAVNLSSGKYTVFDQNHPQFLNALLASASFPVAFQHVEINGDSYSDGGIKQISPILEAINLGATEIDLLVSHPTTRVKKFILNPNIFDIFFRSLDLATDKIMNNDLERANMYNELALAGLSNKRFVKINIFQPETNLIEDLLDFSPDKIKEMIDRGYEDAKRIMKEKND